MRMNLVMELIFGRCKMSGINTRLNKVVFIWDVTVWKHNNSVIRLGN